MFYSNYILEKINDPDQNHVLSHIGNYEIGPSPIENIKNEFINQGNRNINQFEFISNEEFVNMFHYNNNFSFASDNHLHNEQIRSKKRNFLVKAIIILNNNIFSICILDIFNIYS